MTHNLHCFLLTYLIILHMAFLYSVRLTVAELLGGVGGLLGK
jgi:hypothetical protein